MSPQKLISCSKTRALGTTVRCLAGLSASLLAGCTNCDEFAGFDAWHTMIVADASAAAAYQQRGVAAPNCNIKGAERPAASSGNPAAYADPNLLEVARLELERDCYKDAEQSLRERLKRLEDSTIGY